MKAALIADDGKVVTGQTHGDCFSKLSASEREHGICSGFLDEEHGRFVGEDNCEFYLKQIILVRHAESSPDGPLTERGKEQAVRTASFLSSFDLRGFQFLAVPAAGAWRHLQFSIYPLPAIKFAVDYKVDEQVADETHDIFIKRVHQALDWLPARSLIVSHCDFIHVATDMASGESVQFPECIPNCSLTFIDNHRPVWVAREFGL